MMLAFNVHLRFKTINHSSLIHVNTLYVMYTKLKHVSPHSAVHVSADSQYITMFLPVSYTVAMQL